MRRWKKRVYRAKKSTKVRSQVKKSKKRLIKALCISSIIVFVFVLIDMQISDIVKTMAEYQCRTISMLAMNEAVIEHLEENPNLGDGILILKENADKSVASITVDTTKLNEVKATLTKAVAERLMKLEKQDMKIPLGTLLGWQILSGRGPDINLQIMPTSFVQSSTENHVESTGINQTHHSISVHFTVEMSAMVPGYTTSIIVENDVTVAETLIVGNVPNLYANTP